MPNAVTAIFGADAKPFKAELLTMEQATVAFSTRFRNNLTKSFAQLRMTGTTPLGPLGDQLNDSTKRVGGMSTAMRELLVISREIGRGNWARVPGSLTILLQSLGAAVTELIVPLAVVGVSVYALYKHIKTLREEKENWKEITDRTTHSLVEQTKVIKDGISAQQAQVDWLAKQADGQYNLKTATERALKAMREKARFERELAIAKGASKFSIADMDIKQAKAELDLLEKARDEAEERHHREFLKETSAAEDQNKFNMGAGPNSKSALDAANKEMEEMAAIADAIKKKMQTASVLTGVDPLSPKGVFGGGLAITPTSRPANEKDALEVEVAGKTYRKSLVEVMNAYDEAKTEATRLGVVQKELADMLSTHKDLTAKDLEKYNSLKNEAAELKDQLALKSEYLPKLAAAELGKTGHGFGLNAQQRLGAYASMPPQFTTLVNAAVKTAENTSYLKPAGPRPPTPKAVDYGHEHDRVVWRASH